MIDQSFSAKNLYQIIELEKRRGNNLEKIFFQDIYDKYAVLVKHTNEKLKISHNKLITLRSKHISKEVFYRYKRFLKYSKRKLKLEKKKEIIILLREISQEIQKYNFTFNIEKTVYKGKNIYSIEKTPAQYFAMKQLQQNFKALYKIEQANRYQIVCQVKQLLDDKFPKFIVKTDISSFYESISNEKIFKEINNDNLLSPLSKKLLYKILRQYEKKAGVTKGEGIPRGIGISASLAEYYTFEIDKNIKKLNDIIYYARYVDDIIAFFIPSKEEQSYPYKNQIKNILNNFNHPLTLNEGKTKEIDLVVSETKVHEMTYLGYKYTIQNEDKKSSIDEIQISIPDDKIIKYKEKIRLCFEAYSKYYDKKKAYRHLKNRVKFLTGNSKLPNNKDNIIIGIFFSNSLINQTDNLSDLDDYLNELIEKYVKNDNYKKKLKKYGFLNGFRDKTFYKFNSTQYKQIIKVWKNL